jgi:hypothetical protein
MMKKILTLFVAITIISIAFAGEDKHSSRTGTANPSVPGEGVPTIYSLVTFEDNMNAFNTPEGLQARGWVWINQDGGGTSSIFTGNPTVFTAFEGPDSGYAGQNFNGANGFLIDQWLISPPVTVFSLDTLSFYYRGTGSQWDDSIYVKVSPTGGAQIANFTVNYGRTKVPGTWTRMKYVFQTAGTVRFAFHYNIFSGGTSGNYSDYWGLDLVQVIAGPNYVPVELASFNASVSVNDVTLNWSTASETNNKGFEIERCFNGGAYTVVGYKEGKGTTTHSQVYSFTDKGLSSGKYAYRLKQVDFDGTSEYSKIVEVDVTTPLTFSMGQNFPNPFNPTTNIKFNLAVDSKVSLKVFNILGQEVVTLVKGNLAAGSHSVEFSAKGLQSGVYFAKIEANGIDGQSFSSVKKMILNK